ncbi:MAG: hypothetical protein Q4A64_05610 [Porphyromonadaceae bacterium]|nr:hypothetical protein [Porphyromonadaceae bacterium]
MKLSRLPLGILSLACYSSVGLAQESSSMTHYSCMLDRVNVVLDYDKAQSKPTELRLEYADGSADTLHYSSSKQFSRHEFRSKKTNNFATTPINSEKNAPRLELTLKLKGMTRKIMLDNYYFADIAVFIHDTTAGDTNIRSTPNGPVVRRLERGGAYMLVICDNQKGWWRIWSNRISAYIDDFEGDIVANPDGESWIHYSVIAASTRNYSGQTLSLRDQPSDQARAVYSFAEEIFLRPLEVQGEWVKAQTVDKKHQGWIRLEWLCGNALTTCP